MGYESRRAVRLDSARRDLVSHRRRRRPDRNVESFRRVGSAGLDFEPAPENDRRPDRPVASLWCGPLSEANRRATFWDDAHTVAAGLARPQAAGRRSDRWPRFAKAMEPPSPSATKNCWTRAWNSPQQPAFSPRPKAAHAWRALRNFLLTASLNLMSVSCFTTPAPD